MQTLEAEWLCTNHTLFDEGTGQSEVMLYYGSLENKYPAEDCKGHEICTMYVDLGGVFDKDCSEFL